MSSRVFMEEYPRVFTIVGKKLAMEPMPGVSVTRIHERDGNALTLAHHVAEDQGPHLGIPAADQEALPRANVLIGLAGTGFSLKSPHGKVPLDGGEKSGVVRVLWLRRQPLPPYDREARRLAVTDVCDM